MRLLTATEAEVVRTLIADAESMIADLTQVLSPDEEAVRAVRAARGWLCGIRDTGMLSDGSGEGGRGDA